MEIYLLRHGQTVWNTLGRFQGRQNSQLTEYGLEQVDRMGRLLRRALERIEEPVQCHVSPLKRAQVTASRIVEVVRPMALKTDHRLAEVSLGSWDGMSIYEIHMEYPGALDGAEAHDWFFRAPDGESFDAASARLKSWLDSVSGPTVAVSHGLALRLLMGIYLGLPRDQVLRLTVPDAGIAHLANGEVVLLT